MIPETCEQCRFDAERYTVEDAAGTLGSLATRWRRLTAGVEPAVLSRRPEPATWSAVEYAAHSRDVTALMAGALEVVLAQDRPRFRAPSPRAAAAGDPDPGVDFDTVVSELADHAHQLQRRALELPEDAWLRQAEVDAEVIDAGWLLRHAVHDASHHLSDVGRGLYRLGAGAPSATGVVSQLSTSNGGVPKRAVTAVDVTVGGVVGDRQAVRRHHGRMWQALCLWSQEVIASLQAEGHPIVPGAAGENVTLAGLDWSIIRPGVRLRVGGVLAELTDFADPCVANARWFVGRDFTRIDPDRHPGSSRVYASVIEPGHITVGDLVVVEPDERDGDAVAAPAEVGPEERLVAHLADWLGGWRLPVGGAGSVTDDTEVRVVGSHNRVSPGWDGKVHPVMGVVGPGGGVLSVPPDRVDAVCALSRASIGGRVAVGELAAGLPGAFDRPNARFDLGIFRWTGAPTVWPDVGEWVAPSDPRVPAWLRPFNGDVLVAWDDAGGYGAGVGRKMHDPFGHELAVGTEEALRGRGLARRLVAQAARRVLEDGAVPTYHHEVANIASGQAAEAAGFADRGWRVIGLAESEQ